MKAALLMVALLAAHCSAPAHSAGPNCTTACATLRVLGCPEGSPDADGVTCETICTNAADTPSPLPVACITSAPSCEAANNCGSE